jgi:hypothetical protein
MATFLQYIKTHLLKLLNDITSPSLLFSDLVLKKRYAATV